MTLEEKNLKYTTIEENLSNPSPELLKLHPQAKVPLLLHQGAVIHESAIITEYLDDLFPENKLKIPGPLKVAQMRMWTFWCDEIFKPDLDTFKYEWNSIGTDTNREEERTLLVDRLRSHLKKLQDALALQPFLMGSEISLADIHVFPFYRQLRRHMQTTKDDSSLRVFDPSVAPSMVPFMGRSVVPVQAHSDVPATNPSLDLNVTDLWLNRIIERPSFDRVMRPKAKS